MDPFLGEIRCFAFNFAPYGWQQCNGQILPISQYAALFSILGTNYGGNGTSNFALPNLQGLVPIGQGQGLGLTLFDVGETGGEVTHTLSLNEMPSHTHGLNAKGGPGAVPTPVAGSYLAEGHGGERASGFKVNLYTTNTRSTTLSPNTVGFAGNSQPHNNMQPSLTMNWCIALAGVYPARS
jgi:microcystin-dependent protein